LAALGFAAPSQAHAATCTGGATLSGSFGVLVAGSTTTNVPKYLDGVLTFNGACAITGVLTVGEPNVTAQNFVTVSGSYNTNTDGTIAISLTLPHVTAPETYTVGYSQAFGEALGQEDDSTAIATIDLKPQVFPATNPPVTYNNAAVKGTWTASCSSTAGGFSDLNYFTFDGTSGGSGGAGNVSGVDDSNNSARFYDEPYVGGYIVGSNGTIGGNVTVAGETYAYTGVIDNNLNEIQYVYQTPNSASTSFVNCTAKRVVPLASAGPTFSCHVAYSVTSQLLTLFSGGITIYNTGTASISSWTVSWTYSGGQVLTSVTNGSLSQSGGSVKISNTGSNGTIAAGGSYSGVKFSGISGLTNPAPTSFSVNGTTCS